jgi:hypothetical protein
MAPVFPFSLASFNPVIMQTMGDPSTGENPSHRISPFLFQPAGFGLCFLAAMGDRLGVG